MKKINKHIISETGFKTPNNYFDTFEKQLLNELNLKEKVNTSGFKAPDNYLANFKVEIPVKETINSEPKVISLFKSQKWLVAASIAAVLVLLITIPTDQDNSLDFASLDNDSIENYLLTNDLESVELSNLITNTTAFENTILEETLNNIHLEDYLYENIDVEDFNIE